VTVFWQNDTGSEQTGTLLLHDEVGTAVAEWPLLFPSYGAGYFRKQQQIQLPTSLPSGTYTWQITLPGDASFEFGNLDITAPVRVFTTPAMATAVGETLFAEGTPVSSLAGYEIDGAACLKNPEYCPIILVWKSEAETSESYHVFVQLVDETGQLLAQHDGIPAQWSRPTSGWVAGEYISDTHELNIANITSLEQSQLWLGMYKPGDGRLQTSSGIDVIVLPFPAN
jgi:hypothetical protein